MGFLLDVFLSVGDFIVGSIDDIVEVVEENPVATVIATTILTGGVAFAAAPAIAASVGSLGLLGAASTGTAISSLSGAALTNASLASIGGGAIAAGGGGMAAGSVTIAGIGVTTGAGVSGAVVKSTS